MKHGCYMQLVENFELWTKNVVSLFRILLFVNSKENKYLLWNTLRVDHLEIKRKQIKKT